MSRWSPQVGDVWRDIDPRGGRTFRIVGFTEDGTHALCRGGEDGKGRLSRVRLDRFRATATKGYRFIRGAGGREA